MREARRTQVIDATQPIALLDVDNVLDNSQYRWCADDTQDETGRFLRDDELTYNDFKYGPDYVVPAGSKIRLDYTWGFTDEGMSGVVDYEMTTPKNATMKHVVHVILSVYHGDMAKHEGGSGRYYFIEDIARDDDGVFHVHFGT